MGHFQLFKHQQTSLDKTEHFNRVAYYLDMGLGKTFVGSEKMEKLGASTNLVICQKSKISDWLEHFRQFYSMGVFDLTNTKQRMEFFETIGVKVGVINYDLAWRRKALLTLQQFTLVLDESSLIQNETAKRSAFVLKLAPDNVILLSGTPTGGKYEKLWSQLHLLGWKISKPLFWQQYIETEWVEQDGFFSQRVVGYKNVNRLKEKLAQYGAVFMKDSDAGIALPEQTFSRIKTPVPREYLEFMKNRIITLNTIPPKELVGDMTLTRRLYARQLCCLYNPARYDAFMDLVESTDDRLIVFYNFTAEMQQMLDMVGDRPVSYINGSGEDLTAYNTAHNAITFVQYQAGAMGKNLQLANKTIYFSLPEWSELFEQSKKRTHRIGQTRPCFYYILECSGSVEESIFETLQLRKDYTDELFTTYEKTHL